MLRFRLSLMAIILSTSAGFFISAGHAQERLFAVEGVIVDPSGAVIPNAEVKFKGESGTIVSHGGTDGTVNVNLAAGKYVVTVAALAFATRNIDLSVPSPNEAPFRVTLTVAGGSSVEVSTVPTESSESPSVVTGAPSVVQPPATRRRSIRCLFLWRCSAP